MLSIWVVRAQSLHFKDMDKTQHKAGLWKLRRCLALINLLKLPLFKLQSSHKLVHWNLNVLRLSSFSFFNSGYAYLRTFNKCKYYHHYGTFELFSCLHQSKLPWITCMLNFQITSHFLSCWLLYLGSTSCNTQKPTTFFKFFVKIFWWETW